MTSMKKIIDVRIDGKEAHILEDSVEELRNVGFEVEPCESDSGDSIFTTIVETLVEMPELYGYALGVIATLSSIIAMVINYHFYGKLYEHFHKKD